MWDDQHEWQLLPIWYCQLSFCSLPLTSVHICHHCYHFQLHMNHALFLACIILFPSEEERVCISLGYLSFLGSMCFESYQGNDNLLSNKQTYAFMKCPPMGTQVTMFTPTAYIIYIDNPLQEMDDLSCEWGLFAPFHGIMNEEAQKSLRVHWSSTSGDIKDRPDLLINCDWYSKRGELDNSYTFHANWQGHYFFLEILAKD